MTYQILVINPGSTSTKIALYEDDKELLSQVVEHSAAELAPYPRLADQFVMRKQLVLSALGANHFDPAQLSAVMGRGGMIPGLASGGYIVNQAMIDCLTGDSIQSHASNLGAMIAYAIAQPLNIPAYIYDAVTSAELSDMMRVTGFTQIIRQSFCHALNSRATARKYAINQGKCYEDMNFIVAHLGGGISLSAISVGKIIDSISDDNGPFSPERSGGAPLLDVIELCYSGKYTHADMKKMIRGEGGMKAHLGTSDCKEIEARVDNGDAHAALVFEALGYQVAKGIGLLSTVLSGHIDAIILTGGLARSELLTNMIISRVEFIAPVAVMPGENEMEALALGALRILRGEEAAKQFTSEGFALKGLGTRG
jgi:butyrate kinase